MDEELRRFVSDDILIVGLFWSRSFRYPSLAGYPDRQRRPLHRDEERRFSSSSSSPTPL